MHAIKYVLSSALILTLSLAWALSPDDSSAHFQVTLTEVRDTLKKTTPANQTAFIALSKKLQNEFWNELAKPGKMDPNIRNSWSTLLDMASVIEDLEPQSDTIYTSSSCGFNISFYTNKLTPENLEYFPDLKPLGEDIQKHLKNYCFSK